MTPSFNIKEEDHQQGHSESPPRKKRRLQRGLRPRSPSIDDVEPVKCADDLDIDTDLAPPLSDPPMKQSPTMTARTTIAIEQPLELCPVFACQWQGCTAMLHNLETLKAHLTRMHCRNISPTGNEEVYECQWQNCQEQLFDSIGGIIIRNHTFHTADHWHEHLWHQHIADIAWQLGDGRTGGLQLAVDGSGPQPGRYPDDNVTLRAILDKQLTVRTLERTPASPWAPMQGMQLIDDEDFEEMVMSERSSH